VRCSVALCFLLGIALGGVLLAGCASPPSAVSSSPQPTQRFTSAALGVTFRYPASWRVQPGSPGKRSGNGVLISGPSGSVGVIVYYSGSYAAGHARRPGGFIDAGVADLRRLVADAPATPIRARLAVLGGMRLATVEWAADMPASGGGSEPDHGLWCASAHQSVTRSYVRLAVWCPAADWRSDQANLEALLRSVGFEQPRGS
jgi:hypothetical protein